MTRQVERTQPAVPHDRPCGRKGHALALSFAASRNALLAVVLVACGAEPPDRGLPWIANPRATAPIETVVDDVRFITQSEAPRILQLDSVFPQRDTRLLWFRGFATSPLADGSTLTLDGSGGAIRVDPGLIAQRVPLGLLERRPVSIAGDRRGRLWVVDEVGQLRWSYPGSGWRRAATVPFASPAVTGDPRGGVWTFQTAGPTPGRSAHGPRPLLVRFDNTGSSADTIGGVNLPSHIRLADVAEAGHAVVTDELVLFAPLFRDEVLALTRNGDTVWVSRREAAHQDGPELGPGADGLAAEARPVHMGIAMGPGGLVYVLSAAESTPATSRIDVYEATTGRLVRTARMNTSAPTVAVDADGRLYVLDSFRVLTGVATANRSPFAPIRLATLEGDTLATNDLRGRVVLVNFWASWCGPCRVEIPALARLVASISDSNFAFVTMNEDVEVDDARRFVAEVGLEHPVALGKGRLRRRYHYLGLPFTVLLDREGNIVYRWTGFAGDAQVEAIRALIRAELDRDTRFTEQR